MDRLTFELKSDADRRLAEQFGTATYMMTMLAGYPYLPADFLRSWLVPAIALQQIKFFYDAHARRPVGFVTWAFLAPEVAARLKAEPEYKLHLSEWNEGENLWIMDCVAPNYFRYVARYIRDEMFSGHVELHSFKRTPTGGVGAIKRWTRPRS